MVMEDLEVVVLALSTAIKDGNIEQAKAKAEQLAQRKADIDMLLEPEDDSREKVITVNIHIEDMHSSIKRPLQWNLKVSTKIAQLKRIMYRKKGFRPEVQRWIIGKKLASDKESLSRCGVSSDGHSVFLYLMAGKKKLPETEPEDDQLNLIQDNDMTGPATMPTRSLPDPVRPESSGSQTIMGTTTTSPGQPEPPHLMGTPPRAEEKREDTPKEGWVCSRCTFLNDPFRPGCEVCSEPRPVTYQLPPEYRDLERQQQEQNLKEQSYLMHVEEDIQDVISNQEDFSCPVCFEEVPAREGVVLKECLHSCCRECLATHIKLSEEARVPCPYTDGYITCKASLQDREIKALVDELEFLRYLSRSLAQAESQAANSFHCRTNNCQGWCIYEDSANFFRCPVCKKRNCLTCKAIHAHMNCQEYQDSLRRNAIHDKEAKATHQAIQALLAKGDAIHCPVCKIVVMKKDGCEWIRCSMCKTEICWVTKGPRWGPQGHGDTTAGCRCGVNNRKCHPKCVNCH